MPQALPFLAIAAPIASVISSVKAGKEAREQARAEQRRADIQNVRSVRQSIREARLAQASLVSQGAVSGALMGTGVAGGLSSVASQLGGNLNYISQIAEENTNIFNAQIAGARAASNATIFGQVGQLAGGIYKEKTGKSPFSVFTS
jgi:hypothetical protein